MTLAEVGGELHGPENSEERHSRKDVLGGGGGGGVSEPILIFS